MGLSDGERYAKVATIVAALSRMQRFEEFGKRELNPLLDRLWADFLGQTSNSAHWILGSDSAAHRLDECSLLLVSFDHARAQTKEPGWKHDSSPTGWLKECGPIDALRLLDGEERRVFEVLRYAEAYFYAANRYDDRFAAQLAPLTRTLCDVRGQLHRILSTSPVYCVAWMMQRILDLCFPYSDEDVVTRAGREFHWHHDLRAREQDFAVVKALFRRHQFCFSVPAQERLRIVLGFLGRRFHCAHMHKKLQEMIGEHNARVTLALDLHAQGLTDQEVGAELGCPETFAARLRRDHVTPSLIANLCAHAARAQERCEQKGRGRTSLYCYFTQQYDQQQTRRRIRK